VEVPVEIVGAGGKSRIGFRNGGNILFESFLDREFVTFVVDEVDQRDAVVDIDKLL